MFQSCFEGGFGEENLTMRATHTEQSPGEAIIHIINNAYCPKSDPNPIVPNEVK